MDIIDILDNQEFYELVNYEFAEVRELFNLYAYYVPESCAERFIAEASQVKEEYAKALAEIEEYKNGKYQEIVKSRSPLFEEEPSHRTLCLETKIRDKLIRLIEKYFNGPTYKKYRHELRGNDKIGGRHECLSELMTDLFIEKRYIFNFISSIGYWQRHRKYFLSQQDWYSICKEYTDEIQKVNSELREGGLINIFMGSCRLRGTDSIDMDRISYINLLKPYLRTNTEQLKEVVRITVKNLRDFTQGEGRLDRAYEEVNEYISNCEQQGLMIRL